MVSFQGDDIIFSSNDQESTYTLSKMNNNKAKKIEPSAYKKELLEWLFSLDKDDKNLLFLIDNKKYVKLILDMYWSSIKKGHKHFAKFQQSQLKNLKKTTENDLLFSYDTEKKFYSREERECEFLKKRNKVTLEAEKVILDNIRILDNQCIYDLLSLDESLTDNLKHTLEVFNIISENQVFEFEISLPYLIEDEKYYFSDWFHPFSFQTVYTWIVGFIEENIKIKFGAYKSKKSFKNLIYEDLILRNTRLNSFWSSLSKTTQQQFIDESIMEMEYLVKSNPTPDINRDLINFYQKNRERINYDYISENISMRQGYIQNLESPKESQNFLKNIIYERIELTCSLTSLCNKLIISKIQRKFVENEKLGIKKKKKKNKKKKRSDQKNETEKESCFDCTSCETSIFCLNLSNYIIANVIEKFKKNEEEEKKKEFDLFVSSSPKKDKEIKEHIEHHSETTCTRDTRSVTESDFPALCDDLAIFDELDRQKLSKKQKKKMKKKGKKKLDSIEKNVIEEKKEPINSPGPDIQPSPHLTNLNLDNGSNETDSFDDNSENKNSDKETGEIKLTINLPTNQNNEDIKNITNDLFDLKKEEEKPSEEVEDDIKNEEFPKKKSQIADDDFIAVTKKPAKANVNKETKDTKRFAVFSSKPTKKTYGNKSNTSEERIKFEKDSRKKLFEAKLIKKSEEVKKKEKDLTTIKPINTLEIDENINDQNKIEKLIINEETQVKPQEKKETINKGITLCKKKDAHEVLMAKIKRKEIEKQQKGRKNDYFDIRKRTQELNFYELNDFELKQEYLSISSEIFKRKFNNDVEIFAEKIANEAKRMKIYRLLIFKRIEYIVKNLFAEFKAHVKMYGSCVTGLELPQSDLDIVISSFENAVKFIPSNILSKLLAHLSYMKWVKLCKPIFTATIPLLKLELDPNIAFNEFTYPNPPIDYILSNENYELLNLEKPNIDMDVIVYVDISIENLSFDMNFMQAENVGTMSTNFINHYLHQYPQLNKYIIIFKQLLYKYELNKSYQGGISSYCMSLMIIAFLIDFGKFSNDSHEILPEIFAFYGKKFNPKEMGISFKLTPSPFFKIPPNTEFGKLIIYEPITNSKNLALNTFLIDNILNEFRKVDTRISEFKNSLIEKIKKMSYKNLKQFDKISFDELKRISDIEEIKNIDIINDIIFTSK